MPITVELVHVTMNVIMMALTSLCFFALGGSPSVPVGGDDDTYGILAGM